MPVYEYRCLKCGTEFEVRQHVAEHDRREARPVCPRCKTAERVEPEVSTFTAVTSHKG